MAIFGLLFDNTSLPVLQQVMSFSEQRQKLLVHNVANVNHLIHSLMLYVLHESESFYSNAGSRVDNRIVAYFTASVDCYHRFYQSVLSYCHIIKYIRI